MPKLEIENGREIYVSQDGKRTPVVEMEKFHLVNAYRKVARMVGGGSPESRAELEDVEAALGKEILSRMP